MAQIVKEFGAIKPTKFKPTEVAKAIAEALVFEAGKIKEDFDRTTETWTQRPRFSEPIVVRSGTSIQCQVFTNDPRWVVLDSGTGARAIFPRFPGRALSFQPGYKAKTRPRQLRSWPGGRFGDKVARAAVYGYKGIRAREFVATAQEKHQKSFPSEVELSIKVSLAENIY